MLARTFHARVYRWLATLSLAAYGVVGVFGHSLHGLIPCSDESCGAQAAAEDHCGCCDHEVAIVQVAPGPAEAAQFSSAGHDANDCSLCTLLAKIKVGRLAIFRADVSVAHSYHELVAVSALLPAELVLSGAPRGPPLA